MALTHASKLNMARRHLTQEQRRNLIREQLKENPEKSDRQIAKALGVSDKTVGSQRHELESGAEIPQFKTCIGADGKECPRHVEHKPVSFFNPTKREEFLMSKKSFIKSLISFILFIFVTLVTLATLNF